MSRYEKGRSRATSIMAWDGGRSPAYQFDWDSSEGTGEETYKHNNEKDRYNKEDMRIYNCKTLIRTPESTPKKPQMMPPKKSTKMPLFLVR